MMDFTGSAAPVRTSNCDIKCHFSIENRTFQGCFLHSFCIFNRKFRKCLAFNLQFAVQYTASLYILLKAFAVDLLVPDLLYLLKRDKNAKFTPGSQGSTIENDVIYGTDHDNGCQSLKPPEVQFCIQKDGFCNLECWISFIYE